MHLLADVYTFHLSVRCGFRKQVVEQAMGHHPSASQAAAVSSLLQHWWRGAPTEQMFSLGVRAQGQYQPRGKSSGAVHSIAITQAMAGPL